MFAQCDTVTPHADVAESAYAQDLKSWGSQGRAGSSPAIRTNTNTHDMIYSKKTGLPKGITRRGPVYRVDLTVGGIRRTATAGSLDEALTLREQVRTNLKTIQAWTLGTAIDRCYSAVWAGARSKDKLKALADEAGRFFGKDTKLIDLTADRIDDYTLHLKQSLKNSNATVNRKLAAMSKVLTFAIQRSDASGLHRKPHLQRQREGVGRIRVVTKDEEAELYAWCEKWSKPDHADAITVLIDTGLRGSELWNLEVRDVDFKQGLLSIWMNKTDHPRSIPMTQRAREILTRRCSTFKPRPFPFGNDWLGDLWDRIKLGFGNYRVRA